MTDTVSEPDADDACAACQGSGVALGEACPDCMASGKATESVGGQPQI